MVHHAHAAAEECELCGAPASGYDRHVRFKLPDPVLAMPGQHRTPGSWLSHPDDPNASVMMQVPGLGAFVRVLLRVHLDNGGAVTYGTWLGIGPEDLQRAFALWWSPEYASLRLFGALANEVVPGVLGSAVEATVLDPDQTPYVTGSDDPRVRTRLLDPGRAGGTAPTPHGPGARPA